MIAAAALHSQEKSRTVVHKVPPIYPAIARQMGLTGTIVVSATVDPSGKVTKAESTSSNKVFVPAAIEAVKQWKYSASDSTDTLSVSVVFEKN
jgi:TonB family protein